MEEVKAFVTCFKFPPVVDQLIGFVIVPKDHEILKGIEGQPRDFYVESPLSELDFDGQLTFSEVFGAIEEFISTEDIPEAVDSNDIVLGFTTEDCVVKVTQELKTAIKSWKKD